MKISSDQGKSQDFVDKFKNWYWMTYYSTFCTSICFGLKRVIVVFCIFIQESLGAGTFYLHKNTGRCFKDIFIVVFCCCSCLLFTLLFVFLLYNTFLFDAVLRITVNISSWIIPYTCNQLLHKCRVDQVDQVMFEQQFCSDLLCKLHRGKPHFFLV